jgi:hypothetical protein
MGSRMAMNYVISSHGAVDYKSGTTVPRGLTVLFYQRFGLEMASSTGFKLQNALCNPMIPGSQATIQNFKPITSWAAPSADKTYQNSIDLFPDKGGAFRSGIVRSLDNKVIHDIDNNGPTTLTKALEIIAQDARVYAADGVNVHCLFCTA